MHAFSFAVAFLSASSALLVGAVPGPNAVAKSNAQRLARGLPPLPPRKLYDASHVADALKARQSVGTVEAGATGDFGCFGIFNQYTPVCCLTSATVSSDSTGDVTVVPADCYINLDTVNSGDGDCTDTSATNPNPSGYTGYCCFDTVGLAEFSTVPAPLASLASIDNCFTPCSIFDVC